MPSLLRCNRCPPKCTLYALVPHNVAFLSDIYLAFSYTALPYFSLPSPFSPPLCILLSLSFILLYPLISPSFSSSYTHPYLSLFPPPIHILLSSLYQLSSPLPNTYSSLSFSCPLASSIYVFPLCLSTSYSYSFLTSLLFPSYIL